MKNESQNLHPESKILVTGGSGLVGRHLISELTNKGYVNIFAPRSSEFDLRRPDNVELLFKKHKPEFVFALAAKVGGILDNKMHPADFYFDNIRIGAYLFDASARHSVKKIINLGAGCGYPLSAPEPLLEKNIWNGFPQAESAPYSLAKKMALIQGMAYETQYGLKSVTLIPSNLYGAYDNFNLQQAHVIPALVRKFFFAVKDKKDSLEVWGDGTAKRDFIHASDVARAMISSAEVYNKTEPLNIASGSQQTISHIVNILKNVSGFSGEIIWNVTKPSGQLSREFSIEMLKRELPDFSPNISIDEGLKATFEWFSSNQSLPGVRL